MYISILIQVILMEENTLQPGAEEKLKPQINNESKLDKKKVEKKPTAAVKKIATKKDKLKGDSKKTSSTKKKEIKGNEPEKIKSDKTTSNNDLVKEKPDYTKFSLEKLINVFEELSTGDFWLKNQQNLQLVNEFFEEKFQNELIKQKKVFVKQGGKEVDFFFKPDYKKKFDKISFEYRKRKGIITKARSNSDN